MEPLVVLLLLVFGLVETFLGYRVFRVLVVVAGLLVGWSYAPALLAELTTRSVSDTGRLAAAIVGALVFGALAWLAFRALVALYGFAVGYSLGVAALTSPLAALLVAIVAAALAFLVTRPAIIALTALNGAWITVGSALVLLGRADQPPPVFFVRLPELPVERPALLIAVVVIALVGAVVQWRQGTATLGGPP